MLSSIKLKNFKSFKSLDNLKIKPITVLCGTNSCGKSSILQSILLLKQTKESRSSNQSLLLNGKYVHLGDIDNVIYGNDTKELMSLVYQYDFTTEEYFENRRSRHRPSVFNLLRYILPNETRRIKGAVYSIVFSIDLRVSDKSKGYIKTADIDKYQVTITTKTPDGNVIDGAETSLIRSNDNGFEIKWKNIHFPHRREENVLDGNANRLSVNFENLFPLIEIRNISGDEDTFERIPFQVHHFFRAIDDFVININEGVTYVGPLREEPSRRYIYENEVLEIGTKGENAAYIYQTEQDESIGDHYLFNKNDDSFIKQNDVKLKHGLNHWFKLMNIKGFKPDYQSEIIRLKMDANSSSETRVNIADVGFGVSQIFPIVLEGLRMQKNGTLLLEQPEIHLHPNLQMQMADYFISLALSKKNVIIETHSDHIVNRLVRRIVEGKELELESLISIYFVSNSDDGAYLEEVVIDPLRGIANWPDGFFDQTASEQEKIMLAGIKRRKLNRESL
ncbi:DUF3696 domain-containing protein [Photobacterium leiognathi]|uniref:DUF3696 domain-containing protein n=1 Tax=Photobacterium leiognathi TaxID=553611 RepID=UPI002981D37E|nr:DUF3696 domain-containing protein [Photobacterium leiognathi]